jgi:hypothetical protein
VPIGDDSAPSLRQYFGITGSETGVHLFSIMNPIAAAFIKNQLLPMYIGTRITLLPLVVFHRVARVFSVVPASAVDNWSLLLTNQYYTPPPSLEGKGEFLLPIPNKVIFEYDPSDH